MEWKNAVQTKIDPDPWIIQVRDNLEREEEIEEEIICISVFNVPKEMLAAKPEAYIPNCISIGPYHHWRSELKQMENYKIAAARRFQKRIDGHRFDSVVNEVRNYDCRIRSCYHKYLDFHGEKLAWLMALDACFVLECMQFFVKQPDEMKNQLAKVFDPFRRSATHNAIMRDVMMLENQVPLFLLQKLLEIQLGSQAMAEESLFNLVRLDFTDLSPFLFSVPDSSSLRIKERSHILEALYFSLFLSAGKDDLHAKGDEDDEQPPSPGKTSVPQEFSCEWRALLWWKVGPIWKCASGLTQWVMKHPIHFLSLLRNLPGPRPLKGFFNVLSAIDKAEEKKEEEKGSSVEIPPTPDELDIPCVADLYYAGVRFLPSEGDLTTIRFEQATATLHLPKVRLDSNTEVILRNLVAFEASAAPGDLIFIRYVDFMNGIIDTDEDVRLLIKSGIIYNHLESDGKVASLWNSMGKCVKLSKVKYLDKVITDVNSYYKRTWRVAMVERLKKYIFCSWRCLSLVAALILLLLTALQAFCSVFKCKPW